MCVCLPVNVCVSLLCVTLSVVLSPNSTMAYPIGVRPWKIKRFTNAHDNFTQPLDKNQSFDLTISNPEIRRLGKLAQYQKCTENLQWVIGKALENDQNVRAMGAGWSLSKVAVSDDTLINTKNLRLRFKLKAKNFDQAYLDAGNDHDNHRFLQCGNTVVRINDYLEKNSDPPKSLRASGGSNGQTIVGAFSTGTHGAAIHYGALSEMILGLHIVTGPDRHVYIEKASRKVTSDAFHQKLGAEVIIDDDLFNAAVVSFGSFGIIHGVLVEVEDKYLLEQKLSRVPFDDSLEKAATLGDFTAIEQHLKYPADDPLHPLYHFELAINPHQFKYNDQEKGAYIRGMHKVPFRDDYTPINPPSDGYTYGDNTLGLMQSVLDGIQSSVGFLNKALIPPLVNALFNMAYDRPDDAIGTVGETFDNTKFRGKLFSAAFGLDRKDVKKVIDHCLEVNKKTKLAGVMAFRFVKGTQATLGFTHWDNSCVLELDGVDANVNHKFARRVAERLEADGIPYTLHWGKINRLLNSQRILHMYGAENVENWKKQRSQIMSQDVQEAFNNEFMERCGLDDYVPFGGQDNLPT